MNHSDPFQNIFPFILQKVAQEVGDFIGQVLKIQDENIVQGNFEDIFSPSPQKSLLVTFNLKESPEESAYLLVPLNMAIDFGAKLVMLPENETVAYKKQEKLDGELLDAFSEIVNIISGSINSTCQEYISKKKLHFIKGNLDFISSNNNSFALPRGKVTLISGLFDFKDKETGFFNFFFPHFLLVPHKQGYETDTTRKDGSFIDNQEPPLNETENINIQKNSKKETMVNLNTVRDGVIDDSPAVGKILDQNVIKKSLLESIAHAQGELGALLGVSLEFIEQNTEHLSKNELLSNTKEKQVLTKFLISGDKEGEGYILFPLKDAIYFGAILLMIPADSITRAITAGNLEGEVADAFGEITNILVGCCSNQFKTNFPMKLHLKKETLEILVPNHVDLNTTVPFEADDFLILSARIQMDDNFFGPMEIMFPSRTLGLINSIEINESNGEKKKFTGKSTQPQNQESLSAKEYGIIAQDFSKNYQKRIVSVISQDKSQVEVFEENFTNKENVEVILLSPESDLKQNLSHENLWCVFLFIKKVNDLGLAQTIKVRAALKKGCPLIVAGPDWTRTSVLKALKYGATDVLITPFQDDSVLKKCQKHLYINWE